MLLRSGTVPSGKMHGDRQSGTGLDPGFRRVGRVRRATKDSAILLELDEVTGPFM